MSIENKTIDVELLRSFTLQELLAGQYDLTAYIDIKSCSNFVLSLSRSIGSLPEDFASYVFHSLQFSISPESFVSTMYYHSFAAVKFCYDCIVLRFSGVDDDFEITVEELKNCLFCQLYYGGVKK